MHDPQTHNKETAQERVKHHYHIFVSHPAVLYMQIHYSTSPTEMIPNKERKTFSSECWNDLGKNEAAADAEGLPRLESMKLWHEFLLGHL